MTMNSNDSKAQREQAERNQQKNASSTAASSSDKKLSGPNRPAE